MVALDIHMVATMEDRLETRRGAEALLLLTYPSTVPTRYLLAQQADGEAVGKLILNAMYQIVDNPSPALPGQAMTLTRVVLRSRGPEFLNDLTLRMLLMLYAEAVGDLEIYDALRKRTFWAADGNPKAEAIAICLDRDRPLLERLRSLQEFDVGDDFRLTRRMMLSRLTEAERASLDMRQLALDTYLTSRAFQQADAEALAMLDDPQFADELPRLRFIHAYCLSSLGQHDEARTLLNALAIDHPDNPWAQLAARWSQIIQRVGDQSAASADLILQTLRLMRDDQPWAGFSVTYEAPDGPTLEARVVYGPTHHAGLAVWRDGALVVAYEVNPEHSRFYIQGASAISSYNEPGGVIIPKMDLRPSVGSNLHFSMQIVSESLIPLASSALGDVFNSTWFRTDAGITTLFAQLLRRGIFPFVEQDDHNRTISHWSRPNLDDPGLESFTIIKDADGRLAELTFKKFRIYDVVFSDEPIPFVIDWPDLPTDEYDTFDREVPSKVIGKLLELITTIRASP